MFFSFLLFLFVVCGLVFGVWWKLKPERNQIQN